MRNGWIVLWFAAGCMGGTGATDAAPTDGLPTDTTGSETDATDVTGTSAETATDTGTPTQDIYGLNFTLNEDFPTVAEVTWTQTKPGPIQVEYSFDKGQWLQAPPIDGVKGENGQTLVGIPYDVTAEWRIIGLDLVKDSPNPIETPAHPGTLPLPTVVSANESGWDADDKYLLTSVTGARSGTGEILGWGTPGPFYTLILDREGRVVWSRRTVRGRWTLYAQRSITGDHIIYDDFSNTPDSNNPALAVRSYLDEEIEEIDIPGHHHAFIELPDGTIAWGDREATGGEAIMERAPGATTTTEVWKCSDWSGRTGGRGCISNSIHYDPGSDTYVISFYTVEAVVAIDRSTGDTLWYAGRDVDSNGLTFDPPSSQFWWQHGIKLSPEGTLLLSSHDRDGGPSTNFGIEYDIDLKNGVLRRIWDYDAQAFASTNGDIRRLANRNVLHTVGSSGVIKEVDDQGNTVWHIDFKAKGDRQRLLGTSEYLDDLYELLSPDAQGNTKAKSGSAPR